MVQSLLLNLDDHDEMIITVINLKITVIYYLIDVYSFGLPAQPAGGLEED